MTHLNAEEREIVKNLLIQHKDIFLEIPGRMTGYEYRIKVKNSKKVVRRSYPIPLAQRDAVSREIKKMLEWDVIELSESAYCNPLRIVNKSNGEVRVCLDARFINEIIEADNEAPPLIDDLLQHFHGCNFLSTTDMTKGYWQVPLEMESRKYTAFLHNGNLYHFKVIPYGLKTAGAGFVRGSKINFGPKVLSFLTAYIDDLLIPSNSFHQHVERLDLFFRRVAEIGATLNLKKSHFFQREVNMLGFLINSCGVSPDPTRLDVVKNFPQPTNKKQLQGFLGVCGYYRRFVVKHADFVDPFRELLRDRASWVWEKRHDLAFKQLKENFMKAVTLHHYIPGARFYLQCDASDVGMSGVLFQIDEQGCQRIVSIVSRVLSATEYGWTTTEKELGAIIYSLQKFRTFLLGPEFTILTDHQALTFLKTTAYHNQRLLRWRLYLQQYNFSIIHCKGSENFVADYFSRNFGQQMMCHDGNFVINYVVRSLGLFAREESIYYSIQALSLRKEFRDEIKGLERLQSSDANLSILKQNSSSKIEFCNMKGIWYCRSVGESQWRLYIPNSLVPSVLKEMHEQCGHAGYFKLYSHLRNFFFWKYMRRDVKRFTKCCDVCQRVKYINYTMEGEFQNVKASAPNQSISVDFYGPLPASIGGCQFIFVVLDNFSKYVSLYPIKRATSAICLNKLIKDYFVKVGRPQRILSDHGSQFTSASWKSRLESEGVKVLYSSIRHPQSNPSER